MDKVDFAQTLVDKLIADGVADAQDYAGKMPEGKPGDCDLCGEWSGRLVEGACAWCRDRYHLD